MIALGLVLLLVGFVVASHVLWQIGLVVLVIGLVLLILGITGRGVGGRRHYY